MEWEPKLRTRYAGLLMNVLGCRFRDDIPTKRAAFERTVHDYENQSTKTVEDDIKIGVTMLGMEDMRVKDARGNFRDHANTTAHRQSTDATAAPSESEEQRQGQRKQRRQRQRQRQGRQGQRQGQGCQERIVQENKERRSEKVLLLPKDRPCEGRMQKATERPCRCRGEADGSVATRHSSGRAVAVLTPRRETHVNVRHSHALCEQRNVLRVSQ